jgi:hypothetical protein
MARTDYLQSHFVNSSLVYRHSSAFIVNFHRLSTVNVFRCFSKINDRNLYSSIRMLLCFSGVVTFPGTDSTMTWLEKYQITSDALIFVMITRIEPSRDPLHIIPAFTRTFSKEIYVNFVLFTVLAYLIILKILASCSV